MLAAGHEHRELVEILFPWTKPIPLFPDWSVDGIIRAMKYLSFEPQVCKWFLTGHFRCQAFKVNREIMIVNELIQEKNLLTATFKFICWSPFECYGLVTEHASMFRSRWKNRLLLRSLKEKKRLQRGAMLMQPTAICW